MAGDIFGDCVPDSSPLTGGAPAQRIPTTEEGGTRLVSIKMWKVQDVVAAASACYILATQPTPRRFWVRPSLRARSRYSGSALFDDLKKDDTDPMSGELKTDGSFKNFLRMASSDFEHLLLSVGPRIVTKRH
ncbi:hypothetical protein J6590_056041 [Homalodisca vitripennis]|nr:hypothetical protein J6590_056041 [Homalodisca vitripennis]